MPKSRKWTARPRRDAELTTLLRELIGVFRELNATAARLDARITRATERFAAMQRS